MKRFITTISLQGRDLQKTVYSAVDNSALQYDTPHSFPILSAINMSVLHGEKIEIVPIIIKNIKHGNVSNKNYEQFIEQLDRLSADKGFSYKISNVVEKDEDDDIRTLIKTFSDLIGCVHDDDELSACVSYGTKPISTITIMALRYAYKVKKNVSVNTIVYGGVRWNEERTKTIAELFDVTPLFYIDSSIDTLAKMNLEKPEEALRNILNIDN